MVPPVESFPHAPYDWSPDEALVIAKIEEVDISEDHWEVVRSLQEYYKKVESPRLRQVKDALDERFHSRGGIKYLHGILPGGPVAQGCRLAGLHVPARAVDQSFGSVA